MTTAPAAAPLYPGTAMPDRDWWAALWPDPDATLRSVGARPGLRALDVCCGDGYFTVPLARLTAPAQTVGVDLDEQALQQARRDAATAGVDNLRLIHASANQLDALVEGRFDFILLASTLHGVPQPLELLRALRRLLTEQGGKLVVINWHALPREQCVVLGAPRGPAQPLRMPPVALQHLAGGAGLAELACLEVGPYHYASIFQTSGAEP